MKIIGLSSNYHDSSAALVVDGKVLASSTEERFSREKHDPSFPQLSIDFCLREAGLKKEEIDLVAYHEDPINKFSRILSSSMIGWPGSVSTFIHSMKEAVTSSFWIRHKIAKSLNIHPRKIVYIPHHLSHAAHTFFTSPFDEAVIVTLDAVGEWTSTGIFIGNKKLTKDKSKIVPMEAVPFPSSIGLVYSAFTGFLGFKVNSSENSTMALASFGHPIYADKIREIIQIIPDGLFKVDLSYFDFSQTDHLPLTEKFFQTFGGPRNFKSSLPFNCFFDEQINISAIDQRFADIAASIQLVTEEVVIHVVKRAQKISGAKNLCLAGGVVLNCVANGKILAENIFENVYSPPDPGDGGGAMGAALYLSMAKGDLKDHSPITPFLGEAHQTDDFEKMMNEIDPSSWHRYSKQSLIPLKKENLKFIKFNSQVEMLEAVSQLIVEKKIVGWIQGRFENGPRSLGARSILIDPSDTALALKLSSVIKLRANYRPYACSLTPEAAEKSLSFVNGKIPLLAKWMLCAVPVKSEYYQNLKAAMHVDKSTRPQVVYQEENEVYYKLLKQIGKKTGLEAVLNTSFNEAGFPIVNSPTEALISFARTSMDALVIENFLIVRDL